MLTGELRSQVDRIWDAFWTGGISNPLEVIEQITYLLFLRRLDEIETNEESKAHQTKRPLARRIFPEGEDERGRAFEDFRWSKFKDQESRELFTLISEHVFTFLRTLGGDGSTYAQHMKDARFTIPTPALLSKVVDMLSKIEMDTRDTKGRHLRVHAQQNRHCRAERPVPHAAPYHPPDGGADGAHAH